MVIDTLATDPKVVSSHNGTDTGHATFDSPTAYKYHHNLANIHSVHMIKKINYFEVPHQLG